MKLNQEFHHIQRHIIRVLGLNQWARYRDLRMPGVDSSLYNYHLKELLKTGLIEKITGKGYRLTNQGLRYVDHVSIKTFEPRWQPKLISKFVIIDESGRVLMYQKMRQPFVGTWNLPSGKLHYDDESIHAAASRELGMIFGDNHHLDASYRGVVELKINKIFDTITHTIYFVHFLTVSSELTVGDAYRWTDSALVADLDLTPGVREIIDYATTSNSQPYMHIGIKYDRD